jgi:cation/acetate symporter
MAGLVVGGSAALGAIVITMVAGELHGWAGALLSNPAMWATPLAIATAVIVSLASPGRVPAGTTRTLVRLHTPERVTLSRSRVLD